MARKFIESFNVVPIRFSFSFNCGPNCVLIAGPCIYNCWPLQYIKEGLNPDAIMAWTEGLFRYKMNEVAAVVIDPTNLSSCGMGYWFARQIEKTVGIRPKFAYYDKQTLEFVQTDISSQVQKAKAQARRQYEEHNDREGDNDNERNAQKATAKKSSWRQQIKNQSQHLKGHDRVV